MSCVIDSQVVFLPNEIPSSAIGPNSKSFYLVMSCFIRDKFTSQSNKSSKINELISIYKQCIWQVRGAIALKETVVGYNIEAELLNLYKWKACQ